MGPSSLPALVARSFLSIVGVGHNRALVSVSSVVRHQPGVVTMTEPFRWSLNGRKLNGHADQFYLLHSNA